MFHCFPHLPFELRQMVWKHAIRPAQPGAHYFRIYDLDEDPDDHVSRPQDVVNLSGRADSESTAARPILAAPQCLPVGVEWTSEKIAATPASWSFNNPSTYLVDYGLWTACKESRFIIEREFKTQQWLEARKQASDLKSLSTQSLWVTRQVESGISMTDPTILSKITKELEAGASRHLEFTRKLSRTCRFAVPGTTSVWPSSGPEAKPSSRHYFTVFPNQDLFILQVVPGVNFVKRYACVSPSVPGYLDMGLLSVPYASNLIGRCAKNTFHVAFEFDPEWMAGLPPDFVHWEHRQALEHPALASACIYLLNVSYDLKDSTTVFWFIDYQIKRKRPEDLKTDQSGHPVEPYVFYGSDRKFTEVVRFDVISLEGWPANNDFPQNEPGHNAFQFVTALCNFRDGHDQTQPEFGILACEEL